MALDLWVYGDESGVEAAPSYCVISAYIANPSAWESLQNDWDNVVKTRGLTEFHATDFFTRKYSRKDGSSKNPFALWTDPEAKQFIDEIAGVIKKYRRRVLPLDSSVDVKAFNALSHGERRFLTSGRVWWTGGDHRTKWKSSGKPSEPYMLAFQAVVKEALQHGSDNAKVHFVFDRTKNEGLAKVLLKEVTKLKLWPEHARIGGLCFEDSRDFPGIQMADLRGFLINRYLKFGSAMSQDKGYTLNAIGRKNEAFTVFDAEFLEKTLEANSPRNTPMAKRHG